MKKYILILLFVIYGSVSNAQTFKYHISGYYMFNHPSAVDTYTAFKNKIDVDMGSYETNFDLIFNHEENTIKLHDLNNGKIYTYEIQNIDSLGVSTIAYFYKDENGNLCSFCLFQNTEEEKMIVYGSEMNGTFYGWQSVVK